MQKICQKRHPPLWPWPWPGDLDTGMVSWPCLGLPTRWIWWPNTVNKGVKWCVKGLTFDLEYLTMRAKTQNSALTESCIWSSSLYLCNPSSILSKLKEEFTKSPKFGQKRYPPLWPWPWSGDLDTSMACWPCLGLPTRWIWWPNTVIKGVKWSVNGLTFDLEYLTLRAKIRYSASLRFCVWSFCTYLCNLNFIGWEMREAFAKMWKIGKKRYLLLWPWP